MPSLENSFKKYLLGIMGTRWAVQSHEDKYSDGIADLSYSVHGVNGWIELKQIVAWPMKADTLVKPRHYTPEQVNWLKGRGRRGGHCYVLVRVAGNQYFLFSWEYARQIMRGMTKAEYFDRAVAIFDNCPIDPDLFIKALCEN